MAFNFDTNYTLPATNCSQEDFYNLINTATPDVGCCDNATIIINGSQQLAVGSIVASQISDLSTALSYKQAHTADLDAISALTSFGLVQRIAAGTWGTVSATTDGLNFLNANLAAQKLLMASCGYNTISVSSSTGVSYACGSRDDICQVQIGVGSGTYSCPITLNAGSSQVGDRVTFDLRFPASTNPTITIHDGITSTLLHTNVGTGTAFQIPITVYFTGTNWTNLTP